jgi:transposase
VTAVAAPERPAYRPLPHPGKPGRWTRAAILDALRTWTKEVGRPPRRQDWSGEQPARAGDAQRKWMREHPRWPSSSRVAAHFGSWSAALKEAALPARVLTFPTTVPQRVLAARDLAAGGHTPAEIANLLGVSRASAYNYLQARDCPGCGQPLTAPRAERCRDCTRHEPTIARTWTEPEVLSALQDWTEEHGTPPRYRDWTPSRKRPGRWEAESPRWPSAAVVAGLFGSWSSALEAAMMEVDAA